MKIDFTKGRGASNTLGRDKELVVKDLRKEYRKQEILDVIKQLERRNGELETRVIQLKFSNVQPDTITVLIQTEEGKVYADQFKFDKLQSLSISRKAKITYARRVDRTIELWQEMDTEARRKKFEETPDAWEEYLKKEKEKVTEKLKKELEK